MAGEHYVG